MHRLDGDGAMRRAVRAEPARVGGWSAIWGKLHAPTERGRVRGLSCQREGECAAVGPVDECEKVRSPVVSGQRCCSPQTRTSALKLLGLAASNPTKPAPCRLLSAPAGL